MECQLGPPGDNSTGLGSQVVVYGYDFNTAIQTEDGAGVCFGPGNLFFGGCADLVVKWTLEHRSMNVGIAEGDVFLQDDPWVGTNHQMDTAVYAPVFVGGRLFAWVYNVVHQRELGGIEPGGFVQQAHDVYSEATVLPADEARRRGQDSRGRRRRLGPALAPAGLMTLELRSQIAGVELARDALLELVRRYGAPRVKGTMRKMIETTARVVGERLGRLPDGEWTDTRYVSGAVVGDLKPYKFSLSVRKEGDRLTYSNKAPTRASVRSISRPASCVRASPTRCLPSSVTTSTCARPGSSSRSTSSSNTARSPPPITRPRSARPWACGRDRPGPAFEHEAALDQRRHCASHLRRLGVRNACLQPHVWCRPVRQPTANFPMDGIVGGLGAFPGATGWTTGAG